jgi:hypothetical protein
MTTHVQTGRLTGYGQSSMRRLCLISSLLLLITHNSLGQRKPSARAEAKPSITETTEWLKVKLNTYANIQYRQKFEFVRFSGCSISWRVREGSYIGELIDKALSEGQSGARKAFWEDRKEEFTLNFSALDPSKLSVFPSSPKLDPPAWDVAFETANNKGVITQRTIYDSGMKPESYKTSIAWFRVSDEDVALRVSKALQHLITQCGGKKEPF